MAGPALYPRQLINFYTGGTDHGLRRVVARADPRVTALRLHLVGAEPLELAPVATLADPALSFFVALLLPAARLLSVAAVAADGRETNGIDLSVHEDDWRRFLTRQPPRQ